MSALTIADPFDDAIALAKELLELDCDPEDVRWQVVYDLAKRGALRGSEFRLIERYIKMDVTFHLHFSLQYVGVVMQRHNLCAVFEGNAQDHAGSAVTNGDLASMSADHCGRKVTMLVDVREYNQEPEKVMPRIASVVRLQTLDECIRTAGHPVKQTLFTEEYFLPNRRGVSGGLNTDDRELARPLDLSGKISAMRPFDKLEKQMIQCGSAMVDDFSSEHGDVDRGLFEDVQCRCSVRIGNDFNRFILSVFGNAVIENPTLLHCPDDFGPSGLQSITHDNLAPLAAGVECY